MARKNDDDDDEKASARSRSTKEVAAPAATIIGGLPAEDYLTQQEKGAPDPTTPPVDPVPAEVLDIPRTSPYPTGEAA